MSFDKNNQQKPNQPHQQNPNQKPGQGHNMPNDKNRQQQGGRDSWKEDKNR